MASIITATTTSGLTHSADNSGVLQLASGTGNLVTVPSVTGTAMVSGNMPAFSAYASTGTSVTGNVWTKITLDTENFDTNNNFASSRFTPAVAGYYQISACIGLGNTSSQNFWIAIYKNGSEWQPGTLFTTAAGVGGLNNMSSLVYCNGTTDYIELYGLAAVTQTLATGANRTYMNGVLVRAV